MSREMRITLMMKVLYRWVDGERRRSRVYEQANSVMKKMPYVEQRSNDEEDVIRCYDPTIIRVDLRRRA